MGKVLGTMTKAFILILILKLTTLTGSTFGNEIRSNCEPGWQDGTDIGFGCLYLYSGATHTWEEANTYCFENHSTHQVIIETEAQFDFLKQNLELINQITGFTHAWTAGTDAGAEEYWAYPGGCVQVPGFLWHTSLPNGGIKSNFMGLYSGYGWKAYDASSSTTNEITICQK